MDYLLELDHLTQTFHKEFGHLTVDELNWKPNTSTWSVAQNIDHLIVINKTYFPIFPLLRQNQYSVPWIGKIDFMVNWFGKVILQSVNPDRRKKMKTFPLWEPAKSQIGADILDRFAAHQEELKKVIRESADWMAKGTVISSPANKNIVYKLSTAFEIIITHEKRHLQQAREVCARLKENFSPPITGQ
jgi:hypothetical protein